MQFFLVQVRADHAQTAGDLSGPPPDLRLAGHVVEMDPCPVGGGQDAFRTQYRSEAALVFQLIQSAEQFLFREEPGRFSAEGFEDLIRVVAVVVMVMMVMMVTVLFFLILIVMMVMVFVLLLLILIVMMVMMFVLLFLIVMMVMVFVLLFLVPVVMMVMVVLVLFFLFILVVEGHLRKALKLRFQRILLLHDFEDLRACDLVPVRGDDGRGGILLADQRDAFLKLLRIDTYLPKKEGLGNASLSQICLILRSVCRK